MKPFLRIVACGAAFPLGLLVGLALTELVFDGHLHVSNDLSSFEILGMVLAAAAFLWLLGSILAAVVVGAVGAFRNLKRPRTVAIVVGVLIPVLPSLLDMVRGQSLFVSQDNLALAFAGLCVGMAVVWSRGRSVAK